MTPILPPCGPSAPPIQERFRPRRRRGRRTLGFSLGEVMVSSVVGAVVVTSVMTMNNVSSRTMKNANDRELSENAVQRDIETIKSRMNTYTWCSGSGTLSPSSDRNRCANTNKAKKAYYYPKNDADEANFIAACNDNNNSTSNRLLASLITNITAPTLPNPRGVTRTVSVADGNAKRVQLSYSGAGVQRSLTLTPNVVAWCP